MTFTLSCHLILLDILVILRPLSNRSNIWCCCLSSLPYFQIMFDWIWKLLTQIVETLGIVFSLRRFTFASVQQLEKGQIGLACLGSRALEAGWAFLRPSVRLGSAPLAELPFGPAWGPACSVLTMAPSASSTPSSSFHLSRYQLAEVLLGSSASWLPFPVQSLGPSALGGRQLNVRLPSFLFPLLYGHGLSDSGCLGSPELQGWSL